MVRKHVWISGKVQRVWFRQSCADFARKAGVSGWVRNLADGRVEAVFEGDESAVASAIEWCRTGPPLAKVIDVAIVDEEPIGPAGFTVS